MSISSKSAPATLPLVSVFVGCYNHEKFVIEALESVRSQSYTNIELLIWDDCSSDNSVEIIEEWIRKHGVVCKFFSHESNMGVCRSLNEMLSHATGEYVSGLAADDIWLPEKITRQVAELENAPDDVALVYSDAFVMEESGKPRSEMFMDWSKHVHPSAPHGHVFDALIRYNFIPAPTALIRSKAYARVGNYDESYPHEDFDMWLRMAHHFKFKFSEYPSVRYRLVTGSLSSSGQVKIQPAKRLILEKWLIHEEITSSTRSEIHKALGDVAMKLYSLGHPDSGAALHRAWQLTGIRRYRAAALAARLRISYHHFIRSLKTAQAIVRRIRQ